MTGRREPWERSWSRTSTSARSPTARSPPSQAASAAGSALQEAITQQLTPPPTIVSDTDADLVFCYEVQELSLANVAARLIENRNDFVQIAARLHTRSDVAWSGLAGAGSRALAECAAK